MQHTVADIKELHDLQLIDALRDADPNSELFAAIKLELVKERLYSEADISDEEERILERRAAEHVANQREYAQSVAQGWCL